MTPLQPLRGTQSLLGEEADRLHAVISAFDRVRRLFGFKRVEVPVLERTELFARSLGETSDVVSKEMYTFPDKSDRSITLRPEFTAGIARAFLTEGWQRFLPLRVATDGPVFRYEAPQAGRYRQFHQLDAEIIGIAEPKADVEVLALADQLLKELDLDAVVTLKLNTLGDAASREAWRQRLIAHFKRHESDLSPESVDRLTRNPLRILDSKDPRDRPIVENAPKMQLSQEAGDFFDSVKERLDAERIDFDLDPHLVRGLDYYRHTTFEFVTDQLGAQNAVLAGGRYDGLIESLGGPQTPAVGWAAGIERLAMLLPEGGKRFRTAALVIESDEPALKNIGAIMLRSLRRGGMPAQIIADGSIRKRYQRALGLEPDYVLVLEASDDPKSVANLRIRRRIFDRYRSKGAIVRALKPLLQNQFGVSADTLKAIAARGGEVALLRKSA
jgi:histidyl-tRNA synthetase